MIAASARQLYVAWVSGASVTTAFCSGIVGLYEDERTRRLIGGRLAYQSGPHLSLARTRMTEAFLASSCSWALSIDTDMTFTPEDVLALVAAGDPATAPIVGGRYVGFVPATGQAEAEGSDDYLGAGFLLVHRRVFEALTAAQPDYPLPWWEEVVVDGEPLAEDWGFCWRARVLGFPLLAVECPSLGHIKAVGLRRDSGRATAA